MDYEVTLDDRPVGKVQVLRQGLYYRVVCRCDITGEQMYRLEALCGENKVDMGTLIPMERGFGMEMRIPVSRLGEGEYQFRLRSRTETQEHRNFVPVDPAKPFEALASLADAVLEVQGEQMGVSLPEVVEEAEKRDK